jgi:hypothetical protein
MKKKSLFVVAMLSLSMFCVAQNNPTSGKKSDAGVYTALKPADAKPYVFGNQQELADKQASKKGAVLSEIKANQNNPEKLKTLREDLWRIENATVLNKK